MIDGRQDLLVWLVKSLRSGFPLLLATLVGCQHESVKRMPLEGRVSFNGESIADGKIALIPHSREKNAGAPVSAFIQQGKFTFDAKSGPMLGSYRVEVEGYHKTGRQIPDLVTPLPPGQQRGTIDEKLPFVPPKYNSDSNLTAEVNADTKELNFDLKP